MQICVAFPKHTNIWNVFLCQTWKLRLHKQKVTHAEFSPRDGHIVCTSSLDKTVKVWDLRKVKDKNSALHVLEHNRPINSGWLCSTPNKYLIKCI